MGMVARLIGTAFVALFASLGAITIAYLILKALVT